jgi:hypothetical protein
MIGIFCLIGGLSLLWYTALGPMVTVRRLRRLERTARQVEMYKCFAIQSYYPGLEHLSAREISQLYDIDSVFNQIGRLGE